MRDYLMAACLALIAASPAIASCPASREDVTDGIYVGFDGYAMRYQLRRDGSMEEVETHFDGSSTFRFLTRGGVFVTDSWKMEHGRLLAGSHHRTSFAVPSADLPQLSAGLRWSAATQTRFSDGSVSADTMTVDVAQPTQLRLGACSYETLPVQVTRTDGTAGEPYVERMLYLPQLGIGIYLAGGGASETVRPAIPLTIGFEPPETEPEDDGGQGGGAALLPPAGDATPAK
ncbi:hypothetical protein [Rhodophyticola porphyridii]|uniref:DUF3108 domain-containing protein n=1 Tax=Rhodophyticola porphyridii TaxID=1852017 RepID=A0A3L9XZU0_9RHOB|nr:hypothetical protein [Rhodophyticola porphyridii]RMA42069.1 hypothetical protein D9R08_11480 [Rhodophyticola porphyridii]